jgi:hypothetical protein
MEQRMDATKNTTKKASGLKWRSQPAIDPRLDFMSLDEPTLLRDPRRKCMPLARLCEKVAAMQGLSLEELKHPADAHVVNYALLGIAEDGSVMALCWRDEAWLLTRAPVPSMKARELGLVRLAGEVEELTPRNAPKVEMIEPGLEAIEKVPASRIKEWGPIKPVWARFYSKDISFKGVVGIPGLNRITLLKAGAEHEVWQAKDPRQQLKRPSQGIKPGTPAPALEQKKPVIEEPLLSNADQVIDPTDVPEL